LEFADAKVARCFSANVGSGGRRKKKFRLIRSPICRRIETQVGFMREPDGRS
jgi:hypothetical protein